MVKVRIRVRARIPARGAKEAVRLWLRLWLGLGLELRLGLGLGFLRVARRSSARGRLPREYLGDLPGSEGRLVDANALHLLGHHPTHPQSFAQRRGGILTAPPEPAAHRVEVKGVSLL
jgi:hypothetical protein